MKLRTFYILFAACIIGYTFMSNSAGRATAANDGNTGAPGETGTVCATCHAGGAFGTLTETLEVRDAGGALVTEYTPGDTYSITLTLAAGMGTPGGYAFQMTALEDAANAEVGTWQNLGANVKSAVAGNIGGGRTYLEHNGGASATPTFTMEWVAPMASTGNVTFYYAGNAVDGTGTTANDVGSSGSSLSLSEAVVPSDCGTQYFDSGGDMGAYASNEFITNTFCPDNPGDVVTLTFTFVDIEAAEGFGNLNGCWDFLIIYNGDDTGDPLFAETLCGEGDGGGLLPSDPNSILEAGDAFTSSDASGCLTVVFTSDPYVETAGWEADVTCAAPPACPPPFGLAADNITAMTADLSWSTGGSETAWNVSLVPAGTAPNAGFGTSANPLTATGLMPQTEYDYYVQANCGGANLIISGTYDGPLSGGTPKGVELYVVNDIGDLSRYGLGSANNGGGSDGQEFTFPADAVTAGSFIYVATSAGTFTDFFGFAPDYTSGAMSINGNDAIELFENGVVIDVFGDINDGSTSLPWNHLDGWAYRNSGQLPNYAVFDTLNWSYSGPNQLEGDTVNTGCMVPFPIGTFTTTASDLSAWVGPFNFKTDCLPVLGDSLANPIVVPSLPYTDTNSTADCYTDQGGSAAPDVFYAFTTGPCAAAVTISTCNDVTLFDTYLFLLDDTLGTVASNDDAAVCSFASVFSTIDQAPVAPSTTYYIVLDGYDGTEFGDFEMTIIEHEAVYNSNETITDLMCNGDSNGAITIAPTDGTGPYTYLWSNGDTTATITGLTAGAYGVTFADATGCGAIDSFMVNAPDLLGGIPDTLVNVSCEGGTDGYILITATGGTSPYTYLWSNGATTEDITGLVADDYNVTVTDANGCTFISPVGTVGTIPGLVLIPTSTGETSSGASDGTISVNVSGGTSPYTYAWDNGATTASLANLAVGTYCVTVADANSCTSVACDSVGTFVANIDIKDLTNISLAPNPTANQAQLSLSFAKAVDLELEVFNTLGQVLFSQEEDRVLSGEYTINLSDYPVGIYFVRVSVGDGFTVKRLVVSR